MEHLSISGRKPRFPAFLKPALIKVAASVLAAGAPTQPAPAVISRQSVTNAIKIGLVGCGARGTGAASQALKADGHAELVAVADVDAAQIQKCLNSLKRIRRIATQVKTNGREFVGLDAYATLLDSDLDLVLLATPPAFRPLHLAACVDAGKHVFCEKPVATDALGVRRALQSSEEAKAKNLCLVGGLCMRYNPTLQGMFQALAGGAIGRISAYHATYFSSPVRPMLPESARATNMTDTEWQIRNWYNFVWLSGDGVVEQAIHSLDRISWAMNDQPPLHCIGSGGRAVPTSGGNIYDHFSLIYTYPNAIHAILNSRQMDGCHNCILDHIVGTEGMCTYGHGPYPTFHSANGSSASGRIKGAFNSVMENSGPLGARLTARAELDMYQAQQDTLLAAIRSNKSVNDGIQMALSTRLALMGRTAAYTGRLVTWDEMLRSDERLVPEHLEWNSSLTVPPPAQPGRRMRV